MTATLTAVIDLDRYPIEEPASYARNRTMSFVSARHSAESCQTQPSDGLG